MPRAPAARPIRPPWSRPSPTSTPTASRRHCARREPRRCCTATRTAPQFMPWRSTGGPCTRIVLGDWYDQGSVLRWDQDGPEASIAAARRTRMKPEQRIRIGDQLRLQRRERRDSAVDGRRRHAAPRALQDPDRARSAALPPRAVPGTARPPAHRSPLASTAKRSAERASMNAPQTIRSTSRCGSLLDTKRRNRVA